MLQHEKEFGRRWAAKTPVPNTPYHTFGFLAISKWLSTASELVHETDRVTIGLAPEIPEDLYMLIKKVRTIPIL